MKFKRKLVCVLACRNQGSRLYGKPLQNLDVQRKVRVIDYLIKIFHYLTEADNYHMPDTSIIYNMFSFRFFNQKCFLIELEHYYSIKVEWARKIKLH